MKALVGENEIATLPIHDARVISTHTHWSENGDLNFSIIIEVNMEESMQAFEKLGIKTRFITLEFQECWQLSFNLYGCTTRSPVVSGWKPTSDSELLTKLDEQGYAKMSGFLQHNLEFSDGSKFKILARKSFLDENTAK